MTRSIFKRRSPVQEKLAELKKIILEDALNGEKSVIELANIYGVHYGSLLKYYKKNGIKKKRKNASYKLRRIRGSYKKKIKDLIDYIKEKNITKRQIELAVLSICQDMREDKK